MERERTVQSAMLETANQPYCGVPPHPSDLLWAWNLDPVLIVVLAAAYATGLGLIRRTTGDEARRRSVLWSTAFLVLALAFLSPLCALSSALFSARVAHHLLLIAVAAPLAALAFPSRSMGSARWLGAATLAQLLAIWFWHAPQPYAAALSSDTLYWTMESTLLLTAFLYWRAATGPHRSTAIVLFAHLTLIVQMGLLGALITFAPSALYAPHFLTTEPYGLSPLEDQQLAGLLMWVPALLPYLIAALARLSGLLKDEVLSEGPAA